MQIAKVEHEILEEVARLMEKAGFASFVQAPIPSDYDEKSLEASLVTIKAIAAKYDKEEAIVQVKSLMEMYNIQIDELIENIKK